MEKGNLYLISVLPVFAYRIFAGKKKLELRRGVGEEPKEGDVFIVYASGKVKAILGEFAAGRVFVGDYERLSKIALESWTGVTKADLKYIRGSKLAYAIEVVNPVLYKRPLKLSEIRSVLPDFDPPLSFRRLHAMEPVYRLILKKVREAPE